MAIKQRSREALAGFSWIAGTATWPLPSYIPFESCVLLKLCKKDKMGIRSDSRNQRTSFGRPYVWSISQFFRNMAILFPRLLHLMVVFVFGGFGKVRIHRFDYFHFSCSLIILFDFVVIGMVLLDPFILHVDFDEIDDLAGGRKPLLLRFPSSIFGRLMRRVWERPNEGSSGLACSSLLTRATLLS